MIQDSMEKKEFEKKINIQIALMFIFIIIFIFLIILLTRYFSPSKCLIDDNKLITNATLISCDDEYSVTTKGRDYFITIKTKENNELVLQINNYNDYEYLKIKQNNIFDIIYNDKFKKVVGVSIHKTQ
jgi:hypothetical protein